ncbi:hypothetical protein BGW36DRAFT_360126 [Talaromyces proteolyticus]|uniref:Acetoacetate decarboxylase n=1 Tax=Talaromyces proteolyticus TaxID=1131652 RepID=A0AAD4PV89_9EURO|nr:uncharacterized protein BGW36DRAFT_360126 [Talaromyces proteolyticus]KAH8696275.1 hypothetical protein BGW36DRAFT_360126 [Talaromyces proteolyticus]
MSQSRIFHRMPLGYGLAPGPRQLDTGDAHLGWENVKTKVVTVVFRAPRASLSSLLPHKCFRIDADEAEDGLSYASIKFTRLENLPWLAGRGYNHCGLYIHDVVCQGKYEQKRGEYLSVLFENLADPIITGREEIGYAKVFATLDEEEKSKGQLEIRVGWGGTVFGVISLDGLEEVSPKQDYARETYAPSEGLLHFKYIPRTGSNGHDAMYPTFSPTPPASSSIIDRVQIASVAKLEFRDYGFQKLPTLQHIASRLSNLPIKEIVEARVVEATGTTDLREQTALQLDTDVDIADFEST